MVRGYGIYQQGAMFTRADFDPYKTIKYLFDSYGIKLSKRLAKAIKSNKVGDRDFDYICDELDVNPDERTLQSIVVHALNSALLYDIVVDDSEEQHFQNDSVYVSYYTDIVGEFLFDNEDKPHKDIDDECLMVCFYVPCVWDMKDADISTDKYMASLRIKEAVKAFLKDDINWEERLGELYASGCNT